jgi:predicted unusual protein kinase regulating ubiquinone biosynthesis (AarF/ABC1/UbiB family)
MEVTFPLKKMKFRHERIERDISLSVLKVLVSFTLSMFVFGSSAWARSFYLSYEQRVVLTYLLAGAGEKQDVKQNYKDRLVKQAKRFISQAPKEIVVSSFEDFLSAYRGTWPGAHTIQMDLDIIENEPLRGPVVIKGATPDLQKEIQGFLNQQRQMLLEKFKFIPALALAQVAKGQVISLDAYSSLSDLMLVPISEIDHVGEEIGKSIGVSAGKDPIIRLISIFTDEYFKRLSLKSKKQIISSMLGQDLNSNSLKKFELMVQGSGVHFQKLLQILARQQGLSLQLLKVFKQLESGAQPVPPVLVKEIFESERANYNWISYDLEPLGTGTMAQVHIAEVQTEQGPKKVAARFYKPGIGERVQEDRRILAEVAPLVDNDPSLQNLRLPKVTPMVADLDQMILDEFSRQDTVTRQLMGEKAYSGSKIITLDGYKTYLQFAVPKIVQPKDQTVLLVQELMSGSKLDSVQADLETPLPSLKKVVIENVARLWLEEVLFKGGFFHSDLHQGNFLVDVTDERIKVSILDFGMGGVISKLEQKNLLLLGFGIELADPNVIATALWNLSNKDKNEINKQTLFKSIKENMKSGFTSGDDWALWSQAQGLRFSYTFLSMVRGMVIIKKSL